MLHYGSSFPLVNYVHLCGSLNSQMAPRRQGLHEVRLPSNAFQVASANPLHALRFFPFPRHRGKQNQMPVATAKKQQGYAKMVLTVRTRLFLKNILVHPFFILLPHLTRISVMELTVITLFT